MEDIIKRADAYSRSICELDNIEVNMAMYEWHKNAYIDIAIEQRGKDLQNAAEWIREHMLDYCSDVIGCDANKMAEDFMKKVRENPLL